MIGNSRLTTASTGRHSIEVGLGVLSVSNNLRI